MGSPTPVLESLVPARSPDEWTYCLRTMVGCRALYKESGSDPGARVPVWVQGYELVENENSRVRVFLCACDDGREFHFGGALSVTVVFFLERCLCMFVRGLGYLLVYLDDKQPDPEV